MGRIIRKIISANKAFIECTDLFINIDEITKYCAQRGIDRKNITISLAEYPDVFLDIETLEKLRGQLETLTSNVEMQDTESERFAKIVTSIAKNINYAYTKTKSRNRGTTVNFVEGLVKGKCVCIGYAMITKMALEMHGVDAEIVESDMRKKFRTCLESS